LWFDKIQEAADGHLGMAALLRITLASAELSCCQWFAGLPGGSTSAKASQQACVPVTTSTAYSQLYSCVFRTFSEIAGSTTLLRRHLQT